MKEYYVLFSSDAWKSHSSMRLKGVFTKPNLLKVIKKNIKNKNFEFDSGKKIENMEIKDINDALTYAYIETVKINEEL
jgi:hypothetical protein